MISMFNKQEIIGALICIVGMVGVLYVIDTSSAKTSTQKASKSDSTVLVRATGDEVAARTEALLSAVDGTGNLTRMVIDDVTVGEGEAVKPGDTVLVHYVGRLPDGTEFDNSRNRGQTFRFTVGGGQVIAGWEEGVVGMKPGGQRILIIPPDKAYGPAGYGPIPGNATLVFSIDLVAIE